MPDLVDENFNHRGQEIDDLDSTNASFADRFAFPSEKSALRAVTDDADGAGYYAFDFCNSWYTATPISTVVGLRVRLAGAEIPEQGLTLQLRGQLIPLTVASTLHEVWWGYGESAEIRIDAEALGEALTETSYDVEIEMVMRTTVNYGFPDNRVTAVLNRTMEVQR